MKDLKHSMIKVAIAVILSALASCGGPQSVEEPESVDTPELPETPAGVALEASESVEAPTAAEAVAVYLSGEVVVVAGGDASPLEIGESLGEESVIQVGPDGYAEIQLGDRALLRLDSDTELSLERLVLSENEIQATARVEAGSVLSRVERLTGRDSFNLRSEAVAAGVRGTRFKLTVSPEGESTIAVEEGRVALLPGEVDIELLEQEYGEQTQLLAELAPVVEANQQIAFESEALQEVGDRLIETLRNAEGEEIRRAFESAGASLAEQVPPADQINPESLRELRELGRQRLIPLRTETLPTLLPLRLTTEPSSAQLVVRTPSGREVGGSGRFEGVFEQGDELSVTARAEGFESRSFDITMEGEQGYTATITLPELPEREQPDEDEEEQEERGEAGEDETGEGEATEVPSVEEREISFSPPEDLNLPEPVFLTVLTRPGRARIIRNGSTLGEGSAFIETEVGERISLEAELDGFLPVRRTVEVTAEMEPVVEIRLEPQVITEEIVVVTEPSNAEIFFDGSRVGRGTVSRSFETGEQLSVVARAEGYFEANRTITVRPGSGGTYRLELEEEPRVKEITLLADPPSTRIEVNGEFAGRGRHTARYEWGSQLEVELSAPGYLGSSERITVREDGPERFEFSLEEEPEFATLTVQSVPGDARILINGREARRGEQAREFEIGRSVTVEASRPGFEPLERQLTIEEDRRLELRLEPAPVEGEVDYAGDPLVRGFAVAGEDLLFADREGRIYRYTIEGDEIWSHQSANAPNENSIPVVGNGRVYLTGAAEAIALDLDTGEQLFRLPLSEESSHLFGRTVTSLEEGRVLFPDNQGIQLLSGEDGSLVSRIDIPNGGRSSVAVAGNGVLVDQDGVFHIIDLDDLSVVGTVGTALVQPVAARPGIVENVAVAVDRRGRAAGVDLEAEELLWEREVSSGGLFSDPLATREGVFFTSDGSLYALEAQTGRPLFESIAGITTPPAAAEGSLFVGRGTEVLELDPGTGAVRRSLDLGAEVTGRPAIIGERLVVATEEGRFLVINRTGWVASDSAADAGN